MSESEIYGIFRESKLVQSELFGVLTEEDDLKTQEK
jgi:hypothetical protein